MASRSPRDGWRLPQTKRNKSQKNWVAALLLNRKCWSAGAARPAGFAWRRSPDEAAELAGQILAMEIKGLPVRKVLVDEAANIESEIYLGITNDRAATQAGDDGFIGRRRGDRRGGPPDPGKNHQSPYRSAAGTARLPGARHRCRDRPAARALAGISARLPAGCGRLTSTATPHWRRSTRW